MSIVDHFEHAPNTGFVRGYDRGSARRQFYVSLVLVVAIAVAASALAFLIRFDTPNRASDVPAASHNVPSYAGKL